MIAEARDAGAEIDRNQPGRRRPRATSRKLLPTLVSNAGPDLRLMREEIFGPVLPIVEYATVDDAIAM